MFSIFKTLNTKCTWKYTTAAADVSCRSIFEFDDGRDHIVTVTAIDDLGGSGSGLSVLGV